MQILIINSILLGVALAMDAFSVSIANGIRLPNMSDGKRAFIALTYAAWQFIMPMIGWFCVNRIIEYFKLVQPFVPWIALILLLLIGGKMIHEGRCPEPEMKEDDLTSSAETLGLVTLTVQGIATSIDALSVGFTIAEYAALEALLCATIIAIVTFFICMVGLVLGNRIGAYLKERATIVGGIILIVIGIEIFIRGVF